MDEVPDVVNDCGIETVSLDDRDRVSTSEHAMGSVDHLMVQ